jgi:nitrite reductase/ring-hydroxylating ferredoxin subunit
MKSNGGTGRAGAKTLTRRTLLQQAALLLVGGCICRHASGAKPQADCCFTPHIEPESLRFEGSQLLVDLKTAKALASIPSAAYVVDAERDLQMIILRLGRRRFAAFSRLCTHASQVISFVQERGLLQCNNYNHSTFDLEGQVYKGPADKPLARYPVHLQDGVLRIDWRRPA